MHHKISVIIGTRPEAIKLAPVITALKQSVGCNVCITGQHREMLNQILSDLKIIPNSDLNLMAPNQSLSEITCRCLAALDTYLADYTPDLVVVQGDTTTVLCAALASFYRKIPIAHVEAGLRTRDMLSPWPEEANRVLTSKLARLHFAPTEGARRNLLSDGIPPQHVFVTGNTVIDTLLAAVTSVRSKPPTIPGLPISLQPNPSLEDDAKVVLITGHRRENFGEGFRGICKAIDHLATEHPSVHFVYPVHLNPKVRGPVFSMLGGSERATRPNIHLIEPLSYLPFVALMDRATLILTDSGGVQEEAPSLGKPVLVMRDTTERPEAVEAGTVQLVGTDPTIISNAVNRLLRNDAEYKKMSEAHNPYGDGKAAGRISIEIQRFLAQGERA